MPAPPSLARGSVRSSMGNAASNIPYNVAGNVPSYTGKQGWTLHTGTKKENSEPVSIFKLKLNMDEHCIIKGNMKNEDVKNCSDLKIEIEN